MSTFDALLIGVALMAGAISLFIIDRRLRRLERRGAGDVRVEKVEITVSSNQAPGQIARKVVEEIGNLRHGARVSPPT